MVLYQYVSTQSLFGFNVSRDQDKWAYLLKTSTRFRPKAASPRGALLPCDMIDASSSPTTIITSRRVVSRDARPLSRAKFMTTPRAEPQAPQASRLGPTVIRMPVQHTRQLPPSRLSLPQLSQQHDDGKGGTAGDDRMSRVMGYSRQGNEVLERLKSGKRTGPRKTTP